MIQRLSMFLLLLAVLVRKIFSYVRNFPLFNTFCLDFHWDDLHKLFPNHEEYLGKTVISAKEMEEKPPEERHNFITGEEDFNKRSGNAEKYAAITTGLIIITHYL